MNTLHTTTPKRGFIYRTGAVWCVLFLLTALPVFGRMSPSDPLPEDITTLTLEQLMNVDVTVTTVTKKVQQLQDTPSAVCVFTSEDIRRAGVTTLSELLEMVPGYNVSQISSQAFQNSKNNYGKFSQGFHGPVSTSLLILKDGKSILSRITSLNWSQIDLVLEDIDRIEVIRGAAAALWGSSAINGVVNIITKHAADTRGILVSTGVETNDGHTGVARYGARLSRTSAFRIYAKYAEDRYGTDELDMDAGMRFNVSRTGFRFDYDPREQTSWMAMGELYAGAFDFESYQNSFVKSLGNYDVDTDMLGGNLFLKFSHAFTDASRIKCQMYYDRMDVDFTLLRIEAAKTHDVNVGYGFIEEIINLDFLHEYRWREDSTLVWGLESRLYHDDFEETYYMTATPLSSRHPYFSAFLQTDFPLVKDDLFLTLGVNAEHNQFTGYEVQPSLQLRWRTSPAMTLWWSLARGVRTPYRLEDSMYYGVIAARDATSYHVFRFYGNDDLKSEEIFSTEMGYRYHPSSAFFLDLTLYNNIYDHVIYFQLGDIKTEQVDGQTEYEWPFSLTNDLSARAYGGELVMEWRPTSRWTLKAYYAYLKFSLDLDEVDDFVENSYQIANENPKHEVSLQSWLDITPKVELNTRIRYLDELPINDENSYLVVDAQIRWKISKTLDLFFMGKNLTGADVKFATKDYFELPMVSDPNLYIKLEWRY